MGAEASPYRRKITTLRIVHKIISFLLFLCSICIAIWFFRSLYSEVKNALEKNHVPVTISDMTYETDFDSNETVQVAYGETMVINNVPYTYVSIGNYTTLKNDDLLIALGENTVINTDIYTLTFKMSDDYAPNKLWADNFTVVHYGVFGQTDFTEDEINYYSEMAAEYFTSLKYQTLHYEDQVDFVRVDENISVKY